MLYYWHENKGCLQWKQTHGRDSAGTVHVRFSLRGQPKCDMIFAMQKSRFNIIHAIVATVLALAGTLAGISSRHFPVS